MKRKYDERQKMVINLIFKHGLFLLASLIGVNIALYEFWGVEWAPGKCGEALIIIVVMAVCFAELIHSDIYPFNDSTQKYEFFSFGICGIFLIIGNIISLANKQQGLIMNGMLTRNAFGLIAGIILMSLFIYFLYSKYICSKK